MGDPRRLRKKYATPSHPWRKDRLDAERALKNEYALRNKNELWKIEFILKGFKNQAKRLIAADSVQAEKERVQLMRRLERLGLIQTSVELDDVLGLTIRDVLERRLQSIVYRKGLARSMKQARQFIVHNHLALGDKKITAPNYLVEKAEEGEVAFSTNSPLGNQEHPERSVINPIEETDEGKNDAVTENSTKLESVQEGEK
jgi:small subunit ribosomal protein S4